MKKSVNTIANTMSLNKQIVREVYVKSLQELVLQMEEQQSVIEYYKKQNALQRITIKKYRNKIRELEKKKRRNDT